MATSQAARRSVWTLPGIPPLLLATSLAFTGFAALMPTVPLWVVEGGAGTGGAGLTNAILMLFTVFAQVFVPLLLRRLGWRATLSLGLALLGGPSILHLVSQDLVFVLVLTALRGLGFGIITVCGSSAVAELVEPRRRGSAIGAYGLAIAAPQFVVIPLAPWTADHLGFVPVFIAGLGPLVGIPAALALGRRLDAARPAGRGVRRTRSAGAAAVLVLVPPMLILLSITSAGGALLTFTPQMLDRAEVTLAALLVFTGSGTLTRWLIGGPADRFGPRPFLVPLLVVGAIGLGLLAWSLAGPHVLGFLLGSMLVGGAYGSLQNVTLVESFARAERYEARGLASVVWNIGFDSGTGFGSMFVGVLAASRGFDFGLGVSALLCLAMVPVALLPRPGGSR